jgi:hypothetical protein
VEPGQNFSIFQCATASSFIQHARKPDTAIHNWILCDGVDGTSHWWIWASPTNSQTRRPKIHFPDDSCSSHLMYVGGIISKPSIKLNERIQKE